MYKNLGDNFVFVATSRVSDERLELGYEDMDDKYDFVLREYLDSQNEKIAMSLSQTSDVLIFGSAPKKYLEPRYESKKLTFRYSERLMKNGFIYGFNPLRYIKNFYQFRVKEKDFYLLSASGYATLDYNFFGGYINKSFKWGYFPKFKYQDLEILVQKNQITK